MGRPGQAAHADERGPGGCTLTLVADETSDLVLRASHVCGRSRAAVSRSQELVAESRRLMAEIDGRGAPRYFVIKGEVEDHPVRATWSLGKLHASERLLRRGELLTSLHESFLTDRGQTIQAELGKPLPALLTLIRACDRVQNVRLGPTRDRSLR